MFSSYFFWVVSCVFLFGALSAFFWKFFLVEVCPEKATQATQVLRAVLLIFLLGRRRRAAPPVAEAKDLRFRLPRRPAARHGRIVWASPCAGHAEKWAEKGREQEISHCVRYVGSWFLKLRHAAPPLSSRSAPLRPSAAQQRCSAAQQRRSAAKPHSNTARE